MRGLLPGDRHGAPVAAVAAAAAASAADWVPAVAHQMVGGEAPKATVGGGERGWVSLWAVSCGGWGEQSGQIWFRPWTKGCSEFRWDMASGLRSGGRAFVILRTTRVSFLDGRQVGPLVNSIAGAWLPSSSSRGVGVSQLGEAKVLLSSSPALLPTVLRSNCALLPLPRSNSVFGRLGWVSIHGVFNFLRQLEHGGHGEFTG